MNMKKLFRRNQIIITTLAVMIAAAGYLNYAGKQEMASGTDVYEAGVTDISDEDILAENQALTGDPGNYQEIASLDNDPNDESLAAQETDGSGSAVASNQEGVAGDAAADTTNVADNSAAEGGQLAANETTGDLETGLENPGEAVLTSGMNAVSYTHLDVYKRQAPPSPRRAPMHQHRSQSEFSMLLPGWYKRLSRLLSECKCPPPIPSSSQCLRWSATKYRFHFPDLR